MKVIEPGQACLGAEVLAVQRLHALVGPGSAVVITELGENVAENPEEVGLLLVDADQVFDQVPRLREAMGRGSRLSQKGKRRRVLLCRDRGEGGIRGAFRQRDAAVIAGLAQPLKIERAQPVLRGGVIGIDRDPRLEERDRADDLRLVRREGCCRGNLDSLRANARGDRRTRASEHAGRDEAGPDRREEGDSAERKDATHRHRHWPPGQS
jgi:hypothetical protein